MAVVPMERIFLAKFRRKIMHRNIKGQSAKVAIPKWWIGDTEYVELEVYPDKIIITRVEE